ncbi:MAG: pilus assembly protein PilM [Ottowia sp.]|nr:pilus assembly protein PilM [Ottowia sp.]
MALGLTSLFSQQPAPLIGLDVSSSSIKLVELDRGRSGEFELERCALELLEPDWIADGDIKNFDAVAEAVRRTVKKSRTKARNVAMAMPASVVISKKIVLPRDLNEREMEVQVEMEANQYIPFSLDEVSLDFCVMGPSRASPDDVDVMIAASRREKVEDRQALAEAAGLVPTVMDVETWAARLAAQRLVRMLPDADEETVVALFELGANVSGMQVFRGETMLYEREQVFGGAQLTQMLAHQYGFTLQEAEAKKRSGELPPDYGSAVLQPFVTTLAEQVDSALKLFFSSTPNNRVDQIFLAGGSAGLTGLPAAVTQATSFPCGVVDPFGGMDIGRGVRARQLERQAPSYLTACGLAMRRFYP